MAEDKLERVLSHLHNYFIVPGVLSPGTFSISGGTLVLSNVALNQYFKVEGSVFNDGVYKYPAVGMVDETFTGRVLPMVVPGAVVFVSEEIDAWIQKNPDTVYTSESFGGYSRTRSTSAATGSTSTWQDVFRGRLNAWRKVML